MPAGDAIGSSHAISAAFAGDSANSASSGTSKLTVTRYASTLAVAAVTGTPGQSVTLSATPKKSGGAGLSGETVSFSVDGTRWERP